MLIVFQSGRYDLNGASHIVGAYVVCGGVAAEPSHLSLGVASRVALDEFYGLLAVDFAIEVVEELAVAYGLQ